MLSPKIAVCVTSNGLWHAEFGKSLAMLFAHVNQVKLPEARKQQVSLIETQSSMLPQARHTLMARAIKENCTHVLFLDVDMIFPSNILHMLYARDKDFIAANCTTRRFPTNATAHALDGSLVNSWGRTDIQEVRQVGLAVALIKTAPIKRLTPPLFQMQWIPEMGADCGEDVFFCMKLDEIGVKRYVDHKVSQSIKHIGTYAFGHEDIDMSKVEVKHA